MTVTSDLQWTRAPAPEGESAGECERLMKTCPPALAVLWEIRAADARRLEEYRA